METAETYTTENILRKKPSYTEDDLTMALNFIGNGMSIRKAAAACGIPYPTVRRRLIKSANNLQCTFNSKPAAQLTKEEQVMLQNAVLQNHPIFSHDNFMPIRIKKNEVVEAAEDDTVLTENSGNGWKANGCSSDVSETETNSYDWKPTAKVNVKQPSKKRKVQNEDTEQNNNAEFISTLPSSSKEVNLSSTAPFDWTANNEMHGRSGGSHEFVSTTNNQQENSTSTDAVLETLKVCKVLLQQQIEKPNIQNREEIFCNYLCTEIKKVTSDKIFQKLKLDILQLVNNALEENRFQTGRTMIQEIKVEPEIIIDSSNH